MIRAGRFQSGWVAGTGLHSVGGATSLASSLRDAGPLSRALVARLVAPSAGVSHPPLALIAAH